MYRNPPTVSNKQFVSYLGPATGTPVEKPHMQLKKDLIPITKRAILMEMATCLKHLIPYLCFKLSSLTLSFRAGHEKMKSSLWLVPIKTKVNRVEKAPRPMEIFKNKSKRSCVKVKFPLLVLKKFLKVAKFTWTIIREKSL